MLLIRCPRPTVALCALLLVAPWGEAVGQLKDAPVFAEVRVPKAPTVATGRSGRNLIYELHVTNLGPETKWTRLEVLDASSRTLLTLADSALWRDLTRPAQGTIAFLDRPRLAGAQRAVLFLQVPISDAEAPAAVVHRLTFVDSSGTRLLTTRPVQVTPTAVVIGPPLKGGDWFAANGPGNASGHRRAMITLDGTPSIAQRFAIDYVIVDSGFKTYRGDVKNNDNYFAENQDAIAVADARVVAVKDSIPENVPGIESRAVPITLETVGGNHVILDIGGGIFAFYAHLRPGSLRVRVGDRVKRGDVLGKVGNSGNSTEPHLHFHLSDRNSPLGAEGVPYVHDVLTVVGTCRTFGAGCQRKAPQAVRGAMPFENDIVRFRP